MTVDPGEKIARIGLVTRTGEHFMDFLQEASCHEVFPRPVDGDARDQGPRDSRRGSREQSPGTRLPRLFPPPSIRRRSAGMFIPYPGMNVLVMGRTSGSGLTFRHNRPRNSDDFGVNDRMRFHAWICPIRRLGLVASFGATRVASNWELAGSHESEIRLVLRIV